MEILFKTNYFSLIIERFEEIKFEQISIRRKEDAEKCVVEVSLNYLSSKYITREGFERYKLDEYVDISWGVDKSQQSARLMIDVLEDAIQFSRGVRAFIDTWNNS